MNIIKKIWKGFPRSKRIVIISLLVLGLLLVAVGEGLKLKESYKNKKANEQLFKTLDESNLLKPSKPVPDNHF